MARYSKKKAAQVDMNITPLMDVTFQLIVFFILVSNFAAAQLPELELPKPVESVAKAVEEERPRVVVNVVPAGLSGEASHLVVRGQRLARHEYQKLTDLLGAEQDKSELPLEVDLRADRNLFFEHVQPIMQSITRAGIARINLIAHTDDD
jgi:biopolymer transport protein ExbD